MRDHILASKRQWSLNTEGLCRSSVSARSCLVVLFCCHSQCSKYANVHYLNKQMVIMMMYDLSFVLETNKCVLYEDGTINQTSSMRGSCWPGPGSSIASTAAALRLTSKATDDATDAWPAELFWRVWNRLAPFVPPPFMSSMFTVCNSRSSCVSAKCMQT